jgi:hypothetical protein
MTTSARRQDPPLDALSASLRAWFVALARSLLKLLETGAVAASLRRTFAQGFTVVENWVAMLVFVQAAQRFRARPASLNAMRPSAPRGFRSTFTLTGLMRRCARLSHRGALIERARRLVDVLSNLEVWIRRFLARLERGPHGPALVISASPADALASCAAPRVSSADTS